MAIRSALFMHLAVLLTGCSSIPLHENVFHTLNIIDTGQTIHISREPSCYEEVGTIRPIVGAHPSEQSVYLTMAAVGLTYHYTNRWLEKKIASKESGTQAQGNWAIAHAVFNGVMIIGKLGTVMHNAGEGLEPWGKGC